MRFPIDKHIDLESIPSANRFGAYRKHDVHTGIDLFCQPGTPVYAIERGVITDISWFTGAPVDMPWWNDTKALSVEGKTGVFNYGEIEPLSTLKKGEKVKEGDLLGHVVTVLKINKGLPMTMLHLELYTKGYRGNWCVWNLNYPAPTKLLNSEIIFGQKEYNKLTPKAKVIADHNRWFSDDNINRMVKELRITCRLNWGIPRSRYQKWKPSRFLEQIERENKRNPISGCGSSSKNIGIGGSVCY